VTAPYEAASQFQPFELRWDHPQLSDAEVDQSGSFEWWYFDLQTQDGVSLVILFSRRNPVFATRRVSVYIEYKDPDQALHRVRNYAADQLSWTAAGDGGELRIGPHSLRVLGTDPASWRYELELRLPEAQVSLTFVPLHRGFLPSRDGSYFRHARDPDLPPPGVRGQIPARPPRRRSHRGTTRARRIARPRRWMSTASRWCRD
jgi:hypothetical protein